MSDVVRVRYTEGQFLGVDDLVAEQAHRDGAVRRHLLAAHQWGVVSGLVLSARPGGETIVGPGVAVDGYGRTLSLADPVDLPAGTGARDVWLSLVDDVTTVCVAPAGPVDPHHPPGVPPDLRPQPAPAAVGPAPGPWPIFLGRVSASGEPEPDGRVLSGLVGGEIRAPSGRARLQLAAESTADRTRFAVATEDPDGPRARLDVDADGDLTVHGPTRFEGDLAVLPTEQGGVGFATTTTPAEAAPWSCYRTRVERDGRAVDQLRIEIGHPGDGGDPSAHRLVIGAFGRANGPDAFRPFLSVDAAGTVTIHGDLKLTGLLAEGAIAADDPRFATAAARSFLGGVAGATTQLAGHFGAAGVLAPVLTVQVTTAVGAADPHPGEPFHYEVTVNNTGTAAASLGQLYATISLDAVIASGSRLREGETFAPGLPTNFAQVFQVPGDAVNKELKIDVSVLGVGPFADVVAARKSLTKTVRPQP